MQRALSLRFIIAALVNTSAAFAQVVATWDASGGPLPEDDLSARTLTLDGGTCSGSSATLGGI